MASLGMTVRPEDVPASEFDVVPFGEYLCQVIESKITDTKAGNGKILNLTWEIMTGSSAGRYIFGRVNIENVSERAEAIGLRELADMGIAMGLPSIDDSEQLHFKPILLDVAVKEDKTGQYGPQNVIKKYKACGVAYATDKPAETKAAVASQRNAAPQAAAMAGKKRPW